MTDDIDYLITKFAPPGLIGLLGNDDYVWIPGNTSVETLFEYDHIIEYILSKLPSKSDNVTIIYDWHSEGFVIDVLTMMNHVNKILVTEHNLTLDNFALATAASNCDSNLAYYNRLKSLMPYIPNRVYCESTWETLYNRIEDEPVAPNHSISNDKEKKFICLNRTARPHRIALFSQLLDNDLLDDCFFTFYQEGYSPVISELFPNILHSIDSNYNRMQSMMPISLTLENDLYNAYYLTEEDIRLHQSCLFSLITETVFCSDVDMIFNSDNYIGFFSFPNILVSEKTWRTINHKHPFVILGNYKFLHGLREHGYKTFHPYIDESYDLIENDEDRLLAVVREVKRLCNMNDDETIQWLSEVHKITKFNYDLYKTIEFNVKRLGE